MRERQPRVPRSDEAYWADRYIAVCKKRLEGQALQAEEAAFSDAVETAADAVPGVLEHALLSAGLYSDRTLRLAAASAEVGASCYDLVLEAQAQGRSYLSIDMGRGEVKIMRFVAGEAVAELCYQEEFAFSFLGPEGSTETVGPYGGIFVSFERLRELRLAVDKAKKTIRLEKL